MRAKAIRIACVVTAAACLFAAQGKSGPSVNRDEEIIFFPTNASLQEKASIVEFQVHGWVFERERHSLWRSAAVELLLKALDVDERALESDLFRQRAWMFLVDNERHKEVPVRIAGRVFRTNQSAADGHFTQTVRVDCRAVKSNADGCWLRYEALLPEGDARRFRGEAQVLAPRGVSIISDIDDTIKNSGVMDKKELLANTFFRTFQAVPGMSKAYQRWAAAGAVFHYVSLSPWQLYQPLSKFMEDEGFPRGSFHLKTFRLKDRSFYSLFSGASEAMKLAAIEQILHRYPERIFILVGDGGEKDPELYGELARRYPQQIAHIFIRNITRQNESDKRYRSAFAGVPSTTWSLFFDRPDKLLDYDVAALVEKADRDRVKKQRAGISVGERRGGSYGRLGGTVCAPPGGQKRE